MSNSYATDNINANFVSDVRPVERPLSVVNCVKALNAILTRARLSKEKSLAGKKQSETENYESDWQLIRTITKILKWDGVTSVQLFEGMQNEFGVDATRLLDAIVEVLQWKFKSFAPDVFKKIETKEKLPREFNELLTAYIFFVKLKFNLEPLSS